MRAGRRGATLRPFRDFAGITNHGASRVLVRRIVDFAAERSFQATAAALREHYRIEVPLHTIDKATAEISRQAKHFNSLAPAGVKPAALLISETDGSMLPIVGFRDDSSASADGAKTDRRKLRHCHWKEIRVSTARVPGSTEAWYGVAFGEPLAVGLMMADCCRFKGMHGGTRIHAVADGAPWIAGEYDRQFGTRCKFHLDFYHACEHLAAAANSTPMEAAERKRWLGARKESLRASDTEAVMAALEALVPERAPEDESDPVGATIAYLGKRAHQLDYAEAIRQDLPVGSGEIESAHRHVLQKRLKIPGAWWLLKRAEEMAHLRAMRANQQWDSFWEKKCA